MELIMKKKRRGEEVMRKETESKTKKEVRRASGRDLISHRL